jgi:hypothetical protein
LYIRTANILHGPIFGTVPIGWTRSNIWDCSNSLDLVQYLGLFQYFEPSAIFGTAFCRGYLPYLELLRHLLSVWLGVIFITCAAKASGGVPPFRNSVHVVAVMIAHLSRLEDVSIGIVA